MNTIITSVFCLLSGFAYLVPADEPKRLTAEEFEKELSLVESYLGRDFAKRANDDNPGERTVANFAATKVIRNVGGVAEEFL